MRDVMTWLLLVLCLLFLGWSLGAWLPPVETWASLEAQVEAVDPHNVEGE